MKLEYIRSSFDTFSGKVSDLSRQLALAGIAVIWIFKIDNKGSYNLPAVLYRPLYLFCFSLLTDLLQYIYAAIAWGVLLRICKKTKDDDEIKVKRGINTPTWVLFIIKILFLLVAYYHLLSYVTSKV